MGGSTSSCLWVAQIGVDKSFKKKREIRKLVRGGEVGEDLEGIRGAKYDESTLYEILK